MSGYERAVRRLEKAAEAVGYKVWVVALPAEWTNLEQGTTTHFGDPQGHTRTPDIEALSAELERRAAEATRNPYSAVEQALKGWFGG